MEWNVLKTMEGSFENHLKKKTTRKLGKQRIKFSRQQEERRVLKKREEEQMKNSSQLILFKLLGQKKKRKETDT